MRVLLLHNRYRALGGEERVVAVQAALLRDRGHAVEVLERESSEISRGEAAGGLLRGGLDPAAVGARVRAFGADVVHAHNLHPLFGWRALAAARAVGARTVLQLHNFRLFCAVGIAYRDGSPCHQCQGRNTLPGLVHRCRGSVPEAAIYAAGLARQQPGLLTYSDRLIALSEGHLALQARHGLDPAQVSIVPNVARDRDFVAASRAGAGTYALVAGRLVEEKGFDVAVRAAAATGVPLVLAGEGPDRPRLEALAVSLEAPARFTGWLDAAALADLVRGAAVVLVPSRCEEAFGFSVLDAYAAGVPVLSSGRGGLADLARLTDEAPIDPDRPDQWADALTALWRDPDRRQSLGERALERSRRAYGEPAGVAALEAAYQAAGVT